MAINSLVITSEDGSGRSTLQQVSPVAPFDTPFVRLWNIWKVEPGATLPIPGQLPATAPDIGGIAPGEVQVFCFTVPAKTEITGGGDAMEFDGERPGFHSTHSIDIQTCIAGEMTLLLDDQDVTLKAGEAAIIHGHSHGWANRGDVPATMFVTIVGAARVPQSDGSVA